MNLYPKFKVHPRKTLTIMLLCFTFLISAGPVDTMVWFGNGDRLIKTDNKLYLWSEFKNNKKTTSWEDFEFFSNGRFLIVTKLKKDTSGIKRLKGLMAVKEGKEVLPCEFDYLSWIGQSRELMDCRKDGKLGVYSLSTKRFLSPNYSDYTALPDKSIYLQGTDTVFLFTEDLIKLKSIPHVSKVYTNQQKKCLVYAEYNKKIGLVDCKGNILSPIQWEAIEVLSDTMAIIKSAKGYQFFDLFKKKPLTSDYFGSYSYSSYVILTSNGTSFSIYDIKGKKRLTQSGRIQSIPLTEDGNYFFIDKGMYGIVNVSGKIIKDPFVNEVEIISGRECFRGKKPDGQWLLFDFDGRETVPGLGNPVPTSR